MSSRSALLWTFTNPSASPLASKPPVSATLGARSVLTAFYLASGLLFVAATFALFVAAWLAVTSIYE